MNPGEPVSAGVATPETSAPGWSRQELMPYLKVLLLSVLLALALRLRIFEHYQHIHAHRSLQLDWLRKVINISFWLQFVMLGWLGLRQVLPRLLRRRALRPSSFEWLARLALGLSLVNLLSESLAIYRLDIESYHLLFESLLLYAAVSLAFLFWYWVVDQAGRLPEDPEATPHDAALPLGIMFPEEQLERELMQSQIWRPQFTDYLFFVILASNCFGAPEGHLLIGAPIKRLHVLHSLVMVAVVIVIVARAINTLS